MGITRSLAKAFREDFNQAMKSVQEKHGMKISIGSITMNANDLTARVTAKLNEVDGKPIEEVEFKRYAFSYGFKESDYNRKVKINNEFFRFYGFNSKARKNVCLFRKEGTNEAYHGTKTVVSNNFVE